MEMDIPPESPDLDAQHTELQSRYETLQQEHNSILFQQEILVSKCGAQHERINHLENENAEMNSLLEKHTSEQQELNDAYYRAMEEQESGQKVKEQLRDLAYQWKAQSQKNMELNSTCTKLRQELKTALKAGASDRPLESIEQVEPPLLIEATTKVDMESSDDEPNFDDLTPHTWTAGSDDRNQYEIFLVHNVTERFELQGYRYDISQSIEEAVPQITSSLRQATTAFGSDQFYLVTALGICLINTEPVYLFESLQANRTIFIGSKAVLTVFVPTIIAGASSPQSYHSIVTIKQPATQALEEDTTRKGKRKLGVATREITIKRRRAAGAEAMPSTPNTRAKKRKPLGILRSRRVRQNDQAAAINSTPTATEQQTNHLDISSGNFFFSFK
ncbi:hypothetical protein CUC08_Gglean011926 [Alternaria sp. MG1]|nr:hypothetical protein CUC08_Gglean011926 [Alternaria sp. MG1]